MIIKIISPDEVDGLLEKLEKQGYVWQNIRMKPTEMADMLKDGLKNEPILIRRFEEPDFKRKEWVKTISWCTEISVKDYLNSDYQ